MTSISSPPVPRCSPRPALRRLPLAWFVLGLLGAFQPSAGLAQFGGVGASSRAPAAVKFKAPVAYQVFQRDANNLASIPVVLEASEADATVVDADITGLGQAPPRDPAGRQQPRYLEGAVAGVPAGGPYTLRVVVERAGARVVATVEPIFVGDLWVLAGQSNMQGVGDLVDVTPPHPQVMLLGMDGRWKPAEEPLHWLVDSPDPVHSGDPATRAERSAREHKTRTKGAGLGLPFAVSMVENTRIPVGLVACAHGGTSMEQWSPARKGEGGQSLYGSMLRQVGLAGGKVKGMLWYQGESDTFSETAWKAYPEVLREFIASVRADFAQPELPFYLVQIGRFVTDRDPSGWKAVQEAQRLLPQRVPNTAVVSVIDLELDDLIHVGTQGLKRAGQRLARIAQRELFGQIGASTPTLDHVTPGSGNTLIVKFKGVNLFPQPGLRTPRGFAGSGATLSAMVRGGAPAGSLSSLGSPGEGLGLGLKPERHIAGFSIRKPDGSLLPLIYEAQVGRAVDTVVLKLTGPIPPGAQLWYGYGLDPYCNLTDETDMAVPAFGPISLDEILGLSAATTTAAAASEKTNAAPGTAASKPIQLLIITGDHGHDWKATTRKLQEILSEGGQIAVDVTTTPAQDLTDENLARYDVLLLNYKDTPNGPPESRWSDANKEAFLKAVRGGKGLVVFHHASSAFIKPNWEEFERAIAGGWRAQGFHGPKHVFKVKKTEVAHPISEGLPSEFEHSLDELYQNSLMVPGNVVLATAYSDPNKERGTGKDEPVIWVNTYGEGRVYNNALGHDVEAMSNPHFQTWLRRGAIWAATGKVE